MPWLSPSDLQALGLTLRVALVTTAVLLLIATPLAWWLARTQSNWRQPIAAVVALPMVLPPSVLGFYFLVLTGPQGFVGQWTQALGLGLLPFTFWGLVVASCLYSLPFMVQPLQTAMQGLNPQSLEAAATLRASPLDAFFKVAVPLCRHGFVSGIVMSFAHTVGEFGVVLMVGGNIPGVTRMVSVQIYDHVEAMEYADAHRLAGIMLLFSFAVLLALYSYNARRRAGASA